MCATGGLPNCCNCCCWCAITDVASEYERTAGTSGELRQGGGGRLGGRGKGGSAGGVYEGVVGTSSTQQVDSRDVEVGS